MVHAEVVALKADRAGWPESSSAHECDGESSTDGRFGFSLDVEHICVEGTWHERPRSRLRPEALLLLPLHPLRERWDKCTARCARSHTTCNTVSYACPRPHSAGHCALIANPRGARLYM